MAHLYLNEQLESTAAGVEIEVIGSEAKHAVTVARLKVAESISIGNGRGLVASGVVSSITPNRFTVLVGNVVRTERPNQSITLVQALAKGDRDELAIQAATELGVDSVIAWSASRSISRWVGPKVERGLQRWNEILREATKQSLRSWIPKLEGLETTLGLAERTSESQVLVLEPTADSSLTQIDLTIKPISIVVGPEGGISPEELDVLQRSGAQLVRLGDSVLRTSTAGPAALSVLNTRLGRW
ncbi:MAG: 16S rRNA (uracil(1498)-N(3))-methyltransferase [Microbacteriaceae bacterium]|nr:16S rRNA (uracil(1498)-N(3))-methyltransferase [Microbacteriaceae bacterium]